MSDEALLAPAGGVQPPREISWPKIHVRQLPRTDDPRFSGGELGPASVGPWQPATARDLWDEGTQGPRGHLSTLPSSFNCIDDDSCASPSSLDARTRRSSFGGNAIRNETIVKPSLQSVTRGQWPLTIASSGCASELGEIDRLDWAHP